MKRRDIARGARWRGAALSLVPLIAACRGVPAEIAISTPVASEQSTKPTPESIFRDLMVSSDYGCVVTIDGHVRCWGTSPSLAAGHDAPAERFIDAQAVPLDVALAVDGHDSSTCAVLESGKIQCWHWPAPDRVQLRGRPFGHRDDFTDVAVGDSEVCGLTDTGEVHCADFIHSPQRRASAAVDIALGGSFACALHGDGSVWCWGGFARWVLERDEQEPWTGALELGPDGEVLIARLEGAVDIEANVNGNMRMRFEDGSVQREPPIERHTDLPLDAWIPVDAIEGAEMLAHGLGHTCFTSAGKVRCVGSNGWGQLGSGNTRARSEPITVPGLEGVGLVATSPSLSCATTVDSLYCWGTPETEIPTPLLGEQAQHQLADDVQAMVLDRTSVCAARRDGTNLCWGTIGDFGYAPDDPGLDHVIRGQLLSVGIGPLVDREGGCWRDVHGEMVCGVFELASFDSDFHERLRDHNVLDYAWVGGPCVLRSSGLRCYADEAEHPRPLPKLRDVRQIEGGQGRLCAIHEGGAIACMQLERLDHDDRPERIDIEGVQDAVQLMTYDVGYCFGAVMHDGRVRTWCYENGPQPRYEVHQPLDDFEPAAKLIGNRLGFCVLTQSGAVQCRAYHEYDVINLDFEQIVDIASGGNHWCVLDHAGALTCMGDTHWGQLGRMPNSAMLQPVEIEL